MAAIAGVISFPGIDTPVSAVVTRLLGTRPSTAMIYFVEQAGSPDTSGAATFTFGTDTNTITWTNALCDSCTLQISQGVRIMLAVVYDSRWLWQRGTPVVGAYNVRDASGSIIASTEKTLAELATILFTAVGVPGADVSGITSTEKPQVAWEYANPADELSDLLEKRGYVISLRNDNTVKVYKDGVGATLPANDDLVNANLSVDPPEFPETLQIICQRTMVQSMLKCIPVGLDTDGKIKKVEDLSYNPGGVGNVNGWDGMDLESMNFITDDNARECGLQSVGRWYQVDSQADGTFNLSFGDVDYVPGEITVSSASQFLPIKNFLISSADTIYSTKQYEEAFVSGTFWDGATTNPPANLGPFYKLESTPYTFNEDLGIVMFQYPETKYDTLLSKMVFADVYFTGSYSIRNEDTYIHDHLVVERTLGGNGVDFQKADYLQRTLIASYLSGTGTLNGLTDNQSTVETNAQPFLDNMQQLYVNQNSNYLVYRDTQLIETDGVCRQVQWTVSTNGSVPHSTRASQYAEMLPTLPTMLDQERARLIRQNGSPLNPRNRGYLWGMFGHRAPGGGIP